MNFEHLAGKRALGNASAKDYTDWAESALYSDTDSESIAILAGFGLEREPDSIEVQTYFDKSINELGLKLPTDAEAIKNYAIHLCQQVVAYKIAPQEGVNLLDSFYTATDYEPIYSIWTELNEDIWMIKDNNECYFNTGLNKDNIEPYIVSVAEQFINLMQMELPKDFFSLNACTKCNYIGNSEIETIDKPWMPDLLYRLLYRRGQTCQVICSKCKAPFPLSMGDFRGRVMYIESKC